MSRSAVSSLVIPVYLVYQLFREGHWNLQRLWVCPLLHVFWCSVIKLLCHLNWPLPLWNDLCPWYISCSEIYSDMKVLTPAFFWPTGVSMVYLFPPFYFQPIFLYLYLKDVNCQQQHIAGFCFFNFSLLFGGCRQFIFNLIIYTVMFKLILFPVFYLTHLFLACGFLILPPFGTSTFCSLVFLLLAC